MTEQDRYSRQALFSGIGEKGQARLSAASAVLVGCGALGSVQADLLVRAGLGRIRIVDRDFVESTNLQRQVLFTEEDVRRLLPKAVAAADALRRVNSEVEVEGIVSDLVPGNVESILAGFDLLLDGTDNFETRYLINDVAVKTARPWIYGACVGAYGVTLTVRPGETPCLRCLMADPPAAGSAPTCDTAGVIGPAAGVVGAIQAAEAAAEALKILTGHSGAVRTGLLAMDLWQGTHQVVNVPRDPECMTCGRRRFEFLEGRGATASARLCGRNSVQVLPAEPVDLELEALAERLGKLGEVLSNRYLVRVTLGDHQVTVFRDGRAIIGGTEDPQVARSVYARYIGS